MCIRCYHGSICLIKKKKKMQEKRAGAGAVRIGAEQRTAKQGFRSSSVLQEITVRLSRSVASEELDVTTFRANELVAEIGGFLEIKTTTTSKPSDDQVSLTNAHAKKLVIQEMEIEATENLRMFATSTDDRCKWFKVLHDPCGSLVERACWHTLVYLALAVCFITSLAWPWRPERWLHGHSVSNVPSPPERTRRDVNVGNE